jgi:Tol biopolymer transport system component
MARFRWTGGGWPTTRNKSGGRTFLGAVSPDGRRFLMVQQSAQKNAAPTPINVLLNCTEELKRLVPTK